MTKKEAIDIIKCLFWHTRPDEEDIEQAIQALEQEPSGDLFSVIEDIKTEIIECVPWNTEERAMKEAVLAIIDKHLGKESEC